MVAISVLAIQTVAYHYYESMSGQSSKTAFLCRGVDGSCLSVATLINYGNGSIAWHNVSDVPSTWNFYQLTTHIANVEAASYSFGHLVTSINGVQSSGS